MAAVTSAIYLSPLCKSPEPPLGAGIIAVALTWVRRIEPFAQFDHEDESGSQKSDSDSRSLADLHPQIRIMAKRLLREAELAGIPLTVTFTRRSMETQAALYAQGRTTAGRVITNARPGYSYHNFGLAIDVVPTELLRLPKWGDTPEHQTRTDKLWKQVGAIGKAIGFRWGGDFRTIRDRPHFEWSGGLTLA